MRKDRILLRTLERKTDLVYVLNPEYFHVMVAGHKGGSAWVFFLKLSAHIKPVHSKQLIFEGQPFVFIFWDRLAM